MHWQTTAEAKAKGKDRVAGRDSTIQLSFHSKRVLQPAAIRAEVGVSDAGTKDADGNPVLRTDVDFRALRRTCATLFGDVAKDPKSTQAQLRHADAAITLRHYQKSIPETVRAAGDQLERNLGFGIPVKPTIN